MITPRHQARIWIVQFLYQIDLNPPEDFDQALEYFWQYQSPNDTLKGFANRLIYDICNHREDLDQKISAYANNWTLKRMQAVVRNILRLALYEIFYRDDIPPVVSLNEAIDLAKEFSSDESGRFVNGIIDRALKDIQRPLRTKKESTDPWSPGEKH